jgi:hypothetical protein
MTGVVETIVAILDGWLREAEASTEFSFCPAYQKRLP